ncbi:MAG: ROK family transcriptional regulator [Lachnospiraceae bacterium]|nr:ROK family transcriptional regulator [Lachnospiraceae bacterium]
MKLVNQQLIKNTNLKQIYTCVYQNQGISRAALAKQTRLSKTTVSTLVDELIAKGFILDSGTASETTNVGRKPNSLEIRTGKYYVLVLRWEPSYIDVHLTDISGMTTPVKRLEVHPDDSYVDLSDTCVHDLIPSRIAGEKVLGICIVVPAMIDMNAEEIYTTSLQFSATDAEVIPRLKKVFSDYPVALLNDTACFSYAEKIFARVNEPDFAFINFDRGIGATLFINNVMLGRATASYTQFGHYSIDPEGKQCACGNKGCLELMISEDSLKERLIKRGCTSALKKKSSVSYGDLGQAALYGDLSAAQVIRDIALEFSQALSNLICTVHPKTIIIGGKGHELGVLFLDEIKKNIHNSSFHRMTDSVTIRYSLLDSNSCFSGAMKYFFDIHFQFIQDYTHTFHLG